MHSVRSAAAPLNYLTVVPDDYQEGAAYPLVVCLHGFGADCHDLDNFARSLHPSGYLYVLPDGLRTAFTGADLTARAWFERGGDESPEGAREAVAALDACLQEVRQRYHTPPGQMALVGFSQGGNLALRYGVPRPEEVAAVASLSGSLRTPEVLRESLPSGRDQPLLLAHGRQDPLVPAQWCQEVVRFLEQAGYRPTHKLYRAGHFINREMLADLRAWLHRALPPGQSPRSHTP